ncbi:MAG: hypothetical protein AAFV72_09450 [Cyanobacteria bacterium J06635_1]
MSRSLRVREAYVNTASLPSVVAAFLASGRCQKMLDYPWRPSATFSLVNRLIGLLS